ncbi:MAG: Tic22 family protein [Cyanobacteria bacterium J06641_5]
MPDLAQVQEAREVLAAQGKEPRLVDVPLFVATAPNGSYLPLGQGKNQRIPFFFDRDQLEERLQQLREENPDTANTVTVSVVPLGNIIATLHDSNDEQLRSVYLFPSREALSFQRNLR